MFDVFAVEFDETEGVKIEASGIFPDPMEYSEIQHQTKGSRDVFDIRQKGVAWY